MTITWDKLTDSQRRVLITLHCSRASTAYEIMRFCYAHWHNESALEEFLQAIEELVGMDVIELCGKIDEPDWPYDEAQLQYCPTMLGTWLFNNEKDRVLAEEYKANQARRAAVRKLKALISNL